MIKFEPPLLIEIGRSQYLLIFIDAVHILAILTCIALVATLQVKLLLIMVVSGSFYLHLRRYQHGYYLGTIKYTKEFAWQQLIQQQFAAMQILNSSVITSFVIILHVVSDKRRRNILICCDALPSEAYRQLRVALKINTQNAV